MELLSNTPVHHTVPDEYVMPLEKRPENDDEVVEPSVTLPVIDLDSGRCRRRVVEEIITAGKEFGFFQARTHVFIFPRHARTWQLIWD
jgi:hypothetical protein